MSANPTGRITKYTWGTFLRKLSQCPRKLLLARNCFDKEATGLLTNQIKFACELSQQNGNLKESF